MDICGHGVYEEVYASFDSYTKLALLDEMCRQGGVVLVDEGRTDYVSEGSADTNGAEFGGLLYVLV